jgi:TetR/AcrR family transcriptional repressor of nem operon
MPISSNPDNRSKILDAAGHLLQTRGFNAFSYRDLAEIVQIKTSSIHYYFATKEDLGLALIGQYTEALEVTLAEIAQSETTPLVRLQKFIHVFEDTAADGDRLCLAGMLASDFSTLGDALKLSVRRFFQMSEDWLAGQICQLRSEGHSSARISKADREKASWIMATLEGALLTARVLDEPARVAGVGAMLLDTLTNAR